MARRTVDRVDLDAPLAHGLHAPGEDVDPAFLLRRVDLCHLGFWLGLAAYFLPGDTRLRPLAEAVPSAQYEYGGWNWQMRSYPKDRPTTPPLRRGQRHRRQRDSEPAAGGRR
jgi:hypothetical protein